MNLDLYPELESFEPRILHHIRQQTGQQYHLPYILDVAVSQDQRRIREEELLEAVADDDERSFDLDWREEKIRMWANLYDHLGAVSYLNREDPNEILIAPSRMLLAELLQWYQDNGSDPERLARALEWIDEEIVPVFSVRHGTPTVSAGVADVLNDLDAEGVISMRGMSDTEDVVEVPLSSRAGSENIATFTVESVPDRPSYRYPLLQSETEVNA
jgi:hypothetical protein